MNADERNWYSKVASFGCVICGSPCEIHHKRHGAGMGRKSGFIQCFGLCPNHHRLGGHGVAIHAGQKTWEAKYATEEHFVKQTQERIK